MNLELAVVVASKFRVDDLAVCRHWVEATAFGDGGAMEIDSVGRRQSQERFNRDEDDAEIVELAHDR